MDNEHRVAVERAVLAQQLPERLRAVVVGNLDDLLKAGLGQRLRAGAGGAPAHTAVPVGGLGTGLGGAGGRGAGAGVGARGLAPASSLGAALGGGAAHVTGGRRQGGDDLHSPLLGGQRRSG